MRLLDWITARIMEIRVAPGRSAPSRAPVETGQRALGPPPPSAAADDPRRRNWTMRAGWLIDAAAVRSVPTSGSKLGGNFPRHRRRACAIGRSLRDYAGWRPRFQCVHRASRLIDCHVHLAMAGSVDETLRTRLRQAPAEVVLRTIQENLREYLRHGVVCRP